MSQTRWAAAGLAIFSTTLLVAPAAPAQAQPGRGGGGPGAYDRVYDPTKVETVRGTITAIDRRTAWRPGRMGIHLTVKTAKETLPVHLGPAWFIDNLEPPLAVGQAITVKGSRVSFGGKPAIIAASIDRGAETVTLRDEAGRPVWAGWRRQAP